MKELDEWFCANKLSLNTTKTKYIIIKPSQRKIPLHNLKITINGENVTQIGNNQAEHSIKFLGIRIDENLSWKPHIKYTNKKYLMLCLPLTKSGISYPSSH